ncbi:hypothetical protein QBC36DRAFT_334641 [Triangularia setosa]|uniref:Uncharacterized protein n=1 Tax=Triangularia setosa TaxID=2587417 RepID=A0AAN6W258_9PEZI|nr:hypothetical protein QBC36DRAFT_334641 [Podospora setosa]
MTAALHRWLLYFIPGADWCIVCGQAACPGGVSANLPVANVVAKTYLTRAKSWGNASFSLLIVEGLSTPWCCSAAIIT